MIETILLCAMSGMDLDIVLLDEPPVGGALTFAVTVTGDDEWWDVTAVLDVDNGCEIIEAWPDHPDAWAFVCTGSICEWCWSGRQIQCFAPPGMVLPEGVAAYFRAVLQPGVTTFSFRVADCDYGEMPGAQPPHTWLGSHVWCGPLDYPQAGEMHDCTGELGSLTVEIAAFTPDLDGDGVVGVSDLLILLANWGVPFTTADFLELLSAWTPASAGCDGWRWWPWNWWHHGMPDYRRSAPSTPNGVDG